MRSNDNDSVNYATPSSPGLHHFLGFGYRAVVLSDLEFTKFKLSKCVIVLSDDLGRSVRVAYVMTAELGHVRVC